MDKVKIQEIAEEAGLSNADLLEKATELGFDIKAANSSISLENAGVLVEYAISGKLPAGFKKPKKKESKKEVVKEVKEEPKVDADVSVEEPKKKSGITKRDKEELKNEDTLQSQTVMQKVPLKKSGITIVKKHKDTLEPKENKKDITLDNVSAPKKKKAKKAAPSSKESGEKIEIMDDREFMGSGFELYEEEEVVLLDFSDKNIYEEMKRQEQKKKEESQKRPTRFSHVVNNNQGGARRGGRKKKRYIKNDESQEKVKVIEIPENVRVYEFADKVNRSVGEVVKVLFELGTMVTKNDFLDKDAIEILSDEFEVEVTTINPLDALDYVNVYELLDKIRSTRVATKEAGGITQHVGAYQVEKNGKKITFIDTPGHEAFTQMRSRGAQATDIAIIVVAADDGVKPQTKEAISHAKAAGVPMIIAMNKMDKENANPDMLKAGLAELGITSIDWGGEYEFVGVSAHTGEGIDELLDIILLQAEVLELKADPSRAAKAIVIESSVEKGFGPVANIIVKNGSLSVGDSVIVGNTFGRIKAIRLDDGANQKKIGPSTPAAIVGLDAVPGAGEILVAMENEKEARELAEKRAEYAREKQLSKTTKASLDDLSALIAEGQLKTLPVILKADVQGSLEAIKGSLEKLRNDEVKVNIIHEGVGGITESDVLLADAGEHVVILGFNVKPNSNVKQKAKELGVDIRLYSIIYPLLDDVRDMLGGMMSPLVSQEMIGKAEVRETFVVDKIGTIAGCMVLDGHIAIGGGAKITRGEEVVYEGRIASLKRFSDDVKEVKKGFECGIILDDFNDIKAGDVIEAYKSIEAQATL
ncbi:MAG: translation initiation factor IF-2 [Sulfurovaceae bacterium]